MTDLKFDYIKEKCDPKVFIDWYTFEDFYHTNHTEKNKLRHKRFILQIGLICITLKMIIRLNKVGELYYGRKITNKSRQYGTRTSTMG